MHLKIIKIHILIKMTFVCPQKLSFIVCTLKLFYYLVFRGKPYLVYFDMLQCAKTGTAVIITGCPTPQVWVTEVVIFASKSYFLIPFDYVQ